MDLISLVLFDEFIVSLLFGCNFREALSWFVTVFVIAVTWDFVRLVCKYSDIDAEPFENSAYYAELLAVAYNALNIKKILIVQKEDEIAEALKVLLRNKKYYPVVGMDCESKHRSRQPPLVKLLQFANKKGDCVLVRISFMQNLTPQLTDLLSDDNIWKVGVGVYNDAANLLNNFPNSFQIRGTFDLRYLANHFGYPERSLKSLATKLLNAATNKHSGAGSWDDVQLTVDRIMYAAYDAYFGVLLFQKFFQDYLKDTKNITKISGSEFEKKYLNNFFKEWKHKTGRPFTDDFD